MPALIDPAQNGRVAWRAKQAVGPASLQSRDIPAVANGPWEIDKCPIPAACRSGHVANRK